MVETPGYFVHTWNVRVKDMLPTQYVRAFKSLHHPKEPN